MFNFDINGFIREAVVLAPGLLLALSTHEAAHGYVAYMLGDPTAKQAGRLTLNPLRHLDVLGTLAFFLVRFGWAKPVPVNPRYFKNPPKGMMLTGMAGPGANFVLAALSALLFHLLGFFAEMIPQFILVPVINMVYYSVFVNLILGLFNLIPLPPLDGSNILAYFLPPRVAYKYMSLSRYGFILLIAVIMGGDYLGFSLVGQVIMPAVSLFGSLLGIPL